MRLRIRLNDRLFNGGEKVEPLYELDKERKLQLPEGGTLAASLRGSSRCYRGAVADR